MVKLDVLIKHFIVVKPFTNKFIAKEFIVDKFILNLINHRIKLLVKQFIVKELIHFKQVKTMTFRKMTHMVIIIIDFILVDQIHMVGKVIINGLVMLVMRSTIMVNIIANIICFTFTKFYFMFKRSQFSV